MQENKASRVFLIVAVVLGVLATVMAFAYIDNMASESGGGPKIPIMVAKLDLHPNAAIDPARDLEVRQIPAKFQPFAGLCLTPSYSESVKGQKLNRRVLAGQPVMLADLSATGELKPPPGLKAMSLPVKGAFGLSGLLIPGDWVNVLVTQPMPNGNGAMANTIAIGNGTSYQVLAVGSRLEKLRSQITQLERSDSGNESESATVTIAVNDAAWKEILDTSAAFRMPVTLILVTPASAATTTTAAATGK